MKFTFISETDDSKVTMETDADFLDDILTQFKDFLLGSGFCFDSLSTIEIVSPEKEMEND